MALPSARAIRCNLFSRIYFPSQAPEALEKRISATIANAVSGNDKITEHKQCFELLTSVNFNI